MKTAPCLNMNSSFQEALDKHGLFLTRDNFSVLQANITLKCNQTCNHCHLDAGPHRNELMARSTMDDVIGFARKVRPKVIDVTGGAPELHPNLLYFLEGLVGSADGMILRSNLTVLTELDCRELLMFCKNNGINLVCSFPSANVKQMESLRGCGTFDKSIAALRMLNKLGYGVDEGLTLDLVSNPAGAFMSPKPTDLEKRMKRELQQKYDIFFNKMLTFSNVALGRYKDWLIRTSNYQNYVSKLKLNFNPETVNGLMCRNLLSVNWEGVIFDCDFNLALGLYQSGRRTHISALSSPPQPGTPIIHGDHCFSCTAGTGFT